MEKITWVLDPTHSEIAFKVRHMMITNVKGVFKNFSVKVDGEDLKQSSFQADIDVASIDTKNEQRDGHLKSADFFDTEKFGTMTFKSTDFTPRSEGEYSLQGELTIKDVTKPVTLDVEFGGISKDPWGNEKAGFSFETKINRNDWGLNWNAALETGGVLVSEEVKISGEIQLVKQHENI